MADSLAAGGQLVLWDLRHAAAAGNAHARCLAEQLGEDLFELSVWLGHDLLTREAFTEVRGLLDRAETLRRTLR